MSSYLHQIDPFIIQFTETFGIRWYSSVFIVGGFICYFYMSYLAKLGKTTLSKGQIGDLVFWGALGVICGGRLGYVLFYAPHLLWTFSSELPFWKLLAVNEGGMSSHGGFIGVIVALALFSRKYAYAPFLHLLDIISVGVSLSLALGRGANFINGELYGRICNKCFWPVQFPSEMYTWARFYPEKLKSLGGVMESLKFKAGQGTNAIPVTEGLWSSWVDSISSNAFAVRNINYYISKLIMEVQNGNEQAQQMLKPLLHLRHPSQLYQSLLEAFIPFLVIFYLGVKKDLPRGFLGGIFVVLYLVGRFIGEFFRMPDSHIGYQWLNLTRGQQLTALFFVGICGYFFVLFQRLKADRLKL